MLAVLTLGIALHRYLYEYRVTRTHLIVTWLGVTVRRVSLADILAVTKRQKGKAEKWCNTWRTRHRRLVVRRKTGWFKEFVISPAYRYEFRNRLQLAIDKYRESTGQDESNGK